MADSTLIDTLQFGPEDAPTQKYEIYGDDEQTPTYAVIYQQHDGSWQKQDETLSFAVKEEQEEATNTLDYGSGDPLPDLRDLVTEAKERCEQHWHNTLRS